MIHVKDPSSHGISTSNVDSLALFVLSYRTRCDVIVHRTALDVAQHFATRWMFRDGYGGTKRWVRPTCVAGNFVAIYKMVKSYCWVSVVQRRSQVQRSEARGKGGELQQVYEAGARAWERREGRHSSWRSLMSQV